VTVPATENLTRLELEIAFVEMGKNHQVKQFTSSRSPVTFKFIRDSFFQPSLTVRPQAQSPTAPESPPGGPAAGRSSGLRGSGWHSVTRH
jgi:hypothetical protein